MKFIAPEFLYALGFLAIPILIHLFNFRRYKTVKFSQVRFLKSIQKQTQSTSRLKHIIVLICRCLAIIAMVFAFAQPFIEDKNKPTVVGKKGVVIYLDNSFSMQANAEAGSLLDLAKSKALAIADAYSDADKFQLHTNEFSGKQLRWLNKEAFINQLQSVDFNPIFRDFSEVSSRLNAISNDDNLQLDQYILSDLQRSSFEKLPENDSSYYSFLPIQSQSKSNAWISQIESFQPFHLAGLSEELKVVVQQTGQEENKSFNGSLHLNGQLKSPFSVEFVKDSAVKTIQYINPNTAELEGKLILKDYPVVFDDTFFFTYPMKAKIGVLHLYQNTESQSITSLFKDDSLIQFSSSELQQIDFSALNTTSLIVLDNIESISTGVISELTSFVKDGGNIAFFPSLQMNEEVVNPLFQQFGIAAYQELRNDTFAVKSLNKDAKVFENVFEEIPKQINLPLTYSYWKIKESQNTLSEAILSFGDNSIFLKKYEVNSGAIYLSATSLSETQSNFGRHALFVPILYNMALQSVNQQAIAYPIGANKITLKKFYQEESPLKLSKGNLEIIPKQLYKENSVDLFLKDELKEAGFYQVKRQDQVLKTIAFNFNRKESDLSLYTTEEFEQHAKLSHLNIKIINSNIDTLSTQIKSLSKGDSLWKYCVLLASLFIALEILFLRILKG